MKMSFFILLFIFSSFAFAQNNYIVKTEDGRRVLLKADFTWEYIDMVNTPTDSISKLIPEPLKVDSGCNLAQDFVEPELDNNIQAQLKRGRATINDVKKKVAKDYKCDVEDVILLSSSETKSIGHYNFCANGNMVSYKRTGHSILKSGKLLPF
jgi:hypothetical protein